MVSCRHRIGNRSPSAQRRVLKSLGGIFFNGTKLPGDHLVEALGRHRGCCEGAGVDPSKVAHEGCTYHKHEQSAHSSWPSGRSL